MTSDVATGPGTTAHETASRDTQSTPETAHDQ